MSFEIGGIPEQKPAIAFVEDVSTPRQVAEALRSWATENRLLRRGTSPLPIGHLTHEAVAMPADAIGILERQSITAFGVNERRSQVFVYTEKRVTKSQSSILPATASGDVEIIYRQAKTLTVGNQEEDPILGTLPYYVHDGRYTCGSSISVGNQRSAGTLGALVMDKDRRLFGLTNNHVTGGCNNTRRGLPILAPGVMDVAEGSRNPFTIGRHHSVLPFRQGEPTTIDHLANTDAAIFAILDPDAVSSMQGVEYDTPSKSIDPEPDMIVEKVGRSTSLQSGYIESEIVGPWPLTYRTSTYYSPDEVINFVGTVYFEPVYLIRGHNGPFSQPGDSGSLVITTIDNEHVAIGLIFAGSGTGTSYMLPIRSILDSFGVTLVSNYGTD